MPRNLDITALRSFVSVADTGGVTRAATLLNLTQSAVSMQLKRLEEMLGQPLLDRSGRTIGLTSNGEQLLSYARKMVELNDEAWGRMTNEAFEGELNFGVPHDLIYPYVPDILRRFAAEYPRIRINLHSLYTSLLKQQLGRGEMDLILTTEENLDPGGETLRCERIAWVGAKGGNAWRQRPLRFAAVSHCLFRRPAIEALEAEGIPWESAVESISDTAVDTSVSADLAVNVQLPSAAPGHCEIIRHGGTLPELPLYLINFYVGEGPKRDLAEHLAHFVRQAYRAPEMAAAE